MPLLYAVESPSHGPGGPGGGGFVPLERPATACSPAPVVGTGSTPLAAAAAYLYAGGGRADDGDSTAYSSGMTAVLC